MAEGTVFWRFWRLLLAVALAVAATRGRPAAAAALAAPTPAGTAAVPTTGPAPPLEQPVEPQVVTGPGGPAAKAAPESALVLPAALRAAMSRAASGLVERRLHGPAGGVGLDLQGRFQSALVATRGSDGRLVLTCTAADSGITATPAADATEPEQAP